MCKVVKYAFEPVMHIHPLLVLLLRHFISASGTVLFSIMNNSRSAIIFSFGSVCILYTPAKARSLRFPMIFLQVLPLYHCSSWWSSVEIDFSGEVFSCIFHLLPLMLYSWSLSTQSYPQKFSLLWFLEMLKRLLPVLNISCICYSYYYALHIYARSSGARNNTSEVAFLSSGQVTKTVLSQLLQWVRIWIGTQTIDYFPSWEIWR